MSTEPEPGQRYRSSTGERVAVVAVVTERPFEPAKDYQELLARKRFVIIKHYGCEPGYALDMATWTSHDWKPISLADFSDGYASRCRRSNWIIVAGLKDVKSCTTSDAIFVKKSYGDTPGLDGKIYHFREEAREAKRAYCLANKVRLVGAYEHYGAPDSDNGY